MNQPYPFHPFFDPFFDPFFKIHFYCCRRLQLIFEASVGDGKPLHRRMQGHIVLDNIDLGADDPNEAPTSNLCSGHCNFDAGFCGWNNDDRDDFDWKLVKIGKH